MNKAHAYLCMYHTVDQEGNLTFRGLRIFSAPPGGITQRRTDVYSLLLEIPGKDYQEAQDKLLSFLKEGAGQLMFGWATKYLDRYYNKPAPQTYEATEVVFTKEQS